nr:MAG TPA: hypothetical protein [Caudoviricetes sp.]
MLRSVATDEGAVKTPTRHLRQASDRYLQWWSYQASRHP